MGLLGQILIGLVIFYLFLFGLVYGATKIVNLVLTYKEYTKQNEKEEEVEWKSKKIEKQVNKRFNKTLGVWELDELQ